MILHFVFNVKLGEYMKGFIKFLMKSNIFAYSAQCAFYFLLSLFPFLYLVTHFAVLFSISNDALMDAIQYAFPKNVYNLILFNLNTLQADNSNITFGFYVILALWSSSMFIGSLKFSMRQNHPVKHNKSFVYYKLISMLITMVFAILVSTTLFSTLVLNVLTVYLSNYFKFTKLASLIPVSITFSLVIVDLIVLYMFLPPEKIRFSQAVPGAVFSTLGVVIASWFFSYYVNDIANYSRLYGTLGSVIMLMTWLFICSFILILGGLINTYLLEYPEAEKDGTKNISQ